jgi:hypothetical protein
MGRPLCQLFTARCKTSWHKGLPVVKTIYTYGFHELFLKHCYIIWKRDLKRDPNFEIYIFGRYKMYIQFLFLNLQSKVWDNCSFCSVSYYYSPMNMSVCFLSKMAGSDFMKLTGRLLTVWWLTRWSVKTEYLSKFWLTFIFK